MSVETNPWGSIAPPAGHSQVTARRVSESLPWNFYWAVDQSNRRLLLLRHGPSSVHGDRLPKFRALEVREENAGENGSAALVIRLLDEKLLDIFAELCHDIIRSCADCRDERDAVAVAIRRTWKWHYLLAGGNVGRLAAERQMGLVGELSVIDRCLLPKLTPSQVMHAWTGPLGGAKDFVLASCSIESKAVGIKRVDSVRISSECQLDPSDCPALYLHILKVEVFEDGSTHGKTLNEIVSTLRERINLIDAAAAGRYDQLLTAAGYDAEIDYTDLRWLVQGSIIARVSDEFPSITPASIPHGVRNVRYELELARIEPFMVTPDLLMSTIAGDSA